MRRMHDYKGWRFGLTALVQNGRGSARIEVYEPGRPSREQSPMPLGFATKASSKEGILVLARKHTEDWIDRQQSPAKRPGGACTALSTARPIARRRARSRRPASSGYSGAE